MNSIRFAFKPNIPSFEVASARLRCYLPIRYLRNAGWNAEIFQEDAWKDYQLVVFQKAYTEQDQELARRLRARGTCVVLDLCDNHLHEPPDRPDLQGRADKLRRMLDLCDIVTVSTPELGKCLDRPTQVVDDALEEVSFDWHKPWRRARRMLARFSQPTLRLIWFGTAGKDSPPCGLIDLGRVIPTLNELNQRLRLHLTVISNSWEQYQRFLADARFAHRYREFQTQNCQRLFRQADVCIIPVNLNPFTVCKTINRPALSLLLGVPVVAEPIPSYEQLRPFVSLVSSGDWRQNLVRYGAQPSLARRHVTEGRNFLRRRFTEEHIVRQWTEAVLPQALSKCA